MNKIYILGAGSMAYAMACGLIESYDIVVIARDENKLLDFQKRLLQETKKECEIATLSENLNISTTTLILAVKPYALDSVSMYLKNFTIENLISILAGVRLERLKERVEAKRYIRAMPNVAAKHRASATTICGDLEARELSLDIFNKIGYALFLSSQKELDIATALCGSAPAFLSVVAESLVEGAIKEGLSRESSENLMIALFEGFSKLLQNEKPSQIKESITSPGGTTAEGLSSLEDSGVRSAFIKAISATYKKAQDLGKV